jgi:hypothetical protein
MPQIDQQTIHLCHPHKRILVGEARKRPPRIERPGPERLFDHARLCVDGALADFECGTQVRRRLINEAKRISPRRKARERFGWLLDGNNRA